MKGTFVVRKRSSDGLPSKFTYTAMDLVSALSIINKDIEFTKSNYGDDNVSTEKESDGYFLSIRYKSVLEEKFHSYYTITKESPQVINMEDYVKGIEPTKQL